MIYVTFRCGLNLKLIIQQILGANRKPVKTICF
jgi:hypothetical protein